MSLKALSPYPSQQSNGINRLGTAKRYGNDTWQRPGEWPVLPAINENDQMLLGLVAVTPDDSNFLALLVATSAGTYTVDWGDGSIETIATNTQANHKYNYDSMSQSVTSYGYKIAIVKVTPTTANLTTINLNRRHTSVGSNVVCNQWLEIVIAGNNISSLTISASPVVANLSMLVSVIMLSNANLTTLAYLFYNCTAIECIFLKGTSFVTSLNSTFRGCNNLKFINCFDTGQVTTFNAAFYGCYNLEVLPFFNTQNVTNLSYSFYSCYNLKNIPLKFTDKVTITEFMCSHCYSIDAFPLIDMSKVTNSNNMFYNCLRLKEITSINTSAVTNFSGMFQNCSKLVQVAGISFSSATNTSSMFNGCNSLTNFISTGISSALTLTTTMFSSCPNLAKAVLTNLSASTSYANCKLSKTAIQDIFTSLSSNVTTKTITVTGNYGVDTVITKSSTTTTGSKTVAIADTSSLAVGMLVTGVGISDAVAVTFQDTGDTVTLNSHGLANDKIVAFATIVSTTGITVKTPYYVINATTNTFQLSLTAGGSALVLTTNGSGTMQYGSLIQSLVTNTSFTLDAPASGSATNTMTFSHLDTSIATLKGWTVSR